METKVPVGTLTTVPSEEVDATAQESVLTIQNDKDVPSQKTPTTSQTTEEKKVVDAYETQESTKQNPKETKEDVLEDSDEVEKNNVSFWKMILEFLKNLFSRIVSGISNLIGGEDS